MQGQNIEDFCKILHYKNLLNISKVVETKLVNKYYNNLLTKYFKIKNTIKFIT